MTTALYRLSGGEVVKISLTNQAFAQRDTNYWGVATDPAFPDGIELRENGNGPLRVLGFAKIMDGGSCRNATAPEIATFATAETADENLMDQTGARGLFAVHPRWRKLQIAIIDVNILEFNIQREWNMDLKAGVAAATNLTEFKAAIAALPDQAPRTLAAFRAAVLARISEDD